MEMGRFSFSQGGGLIEGNLGLASGLIYKCDGVELGLCPDPWQDLESRTPNTVPYTTMGQFLGTLQGEPKP